MICTQESPQEVCERTVSSHARGAGLTAWRALLEMDKYASGIRTLGECGGNACWRSPSEKELSWCLVWQLVMYSDFPQRLFLRSTLSVYCASTDCIVRRMRFQDVRRIRCRQSRRRCQDLYGQYCCCGLCFNKLRLRLFMCSLSRVCRKKLRR